MNALVVLAKSAVENYLKQKKIISASKDLPPEFLKRKAGVFVTIEKEGRLRGCIGTYLPIRQSIAEEIIHNAIAAATDDYRFNPIEEKELSFLEYTVYILNKPEPVKSLKELNPKKYGIIVKSELKKTGLLLPDLKDINTAQEQIFLACQKAGIILKSEKIFIYKFLVEKYQ